MTFILICEIINCLDIYCSYVLWDFISQHVSPHAVRNSRNIIYLPPTNTANSKAPILVYITQLCKFIIFIIIFTQDFFQNKILKKRDDIQIHLKEYYGRMIVIVGEMSGEQ